MTRIFAFVLILAAWGSTLGPPARAQAEGAISIAAFNGKWSGSGISKTSQSLYFGVTVRDLDVTIAAKGPGFTIAWTTVLRQGGDPNNPTVRRKSASLVFVPSKNGRFFTTSSLGDPLAGEDFTWARIDKKTLSIFILTIDDDGVYDMQVYARTLAAPGMDLRFTRIRGDEAQRTVEGKLVKVAN